MSEWKHTAQYDTRGQKPVVNKLEDTLANFGIEVVDYLLSKPDKRITEAEVELFIIPLMKKYEDELTDWIDKEIIGEVEWEELVGNNADMRRRGRNQLRAEMRKKLGR